MHCISAWPLASVDFPINVLLFTIWNMGWQLFLVEGLEWPSSGLRQTGTRTWPPPLLLPATQLQHGVCGAPCLPKCWVPNSVRCRKNSPSAEPLAPDCSLACCLVPLNAAKDMALGRRLLTPGMKPGAERNSATPLLQFSLLFWVLSKCPKYLIEKKCRHLRFS